MCLFTLQPNGSLYITFLGLMNMTKNFVFIDVIARLEAEYQFWGVFCPVKDNRTLDKGDAEPPLVISSVEHAHNDHVSMDDSEAVDMEIDMVGAQGRSQNLKLEGAALLLVVCNDFSFQLCCYLVA